MSVFGSLGSSNQGGLGGSNSTPEDMLRRLAAPQMDAMRKAFADKVPHARTYAGILQVGSAIAGARFPKLSADEKAWIGEQILNDFLAKGSNTAQRTRIARIVHEALQAEHQRRTQMFEMLKGITERYDQSAKNVIQSMRQ